VQARVEARQDLQAQRELRGAGMQTLMRLK
jgi:hypothetical protein